MCIIAIKPAGQELFPVETIKTMYTNNKDGAGYCYTLNGKVKIRKGFMTVNSLLASLRTVPNPTETPMILHFRIGTHGKNIASNTHPFPVSDSVEALQATKVKTSLAMVHNGVIGVSPRADISDTMEYILTVVKPLQQLNPDFYKTEQGISILATTCKSKLAFLDGQGVITTVGDFKEVDGYLYSNASYEPKKYYSTYNTSLSKSGGYTYPPTSFDKYSEYASDSYSALFRPKFAYVSKIPSGSYIVVDDDDLYESMELPKSYDMWLEEALEDGLYIDHRGNIYKLSEDGKSLVELTKYCGERVYNSKGERVHYMYQGSEQFPLKAEEEVK